MDFQGADADPLLQAAATATQQGAAAGGQFLQAKGLAQYVVGTRIEQGDNRLGARAGREHHHGTAQLGRQPQGRTLIQQFGADQQIGRLVLTDLQGLPGGRHGRGQVAILTQALGQYRAQGGMGIHHKHPLGLVSSLGNLLTGWYWRSWGADGERPMTFLR